MANFWDFVTREKEEEVVEQRAKRDLNVYLNGVITGTSSDRYTAEQVLTIPVANACLAIIVNSIKDLPIELYERIDEKTVKSLTDDYRIRLLNDQPNTVSTGVDFKARMIRDIVLHGNAYVEIEKDGNKIESLWNLDPRLVAISTLTDPVKPYIIKDIVIRITGSSVPLKIDEVMIAVADSDDLGLSGNGVIAYGDKIIELALNELELSSNIMNNGSSPASILKIEKNLSPDAQQRLRDSWEKLYKGASNSGKLVILEEGMSYEKMTYSPSELGISDLMNSTSSSICQLFNVPEQMVSASANTYGSVESMSIRFLQYCISPIISIIESSLNRSLLLEKEKGRLFFKINTDTVLQSTQQERYEALNTGISSGILSINEARIKENLPPIDDNFHRLSLGAVMYQPEDRTYFIPNMGTVYSAKDKKIISSPDMAKEGVQENDTPTPIKEPSQPQQLKNNEKQQNNVKEESDNNVKESS